MVAFYPILKGFFDIILSKIIKIILYNSRKALPSNAA